MDENETNTFTNVFHNLQNNLIYLVTSKNCSLIFFYKFVGIIKYTINVTNV